MWLIPWVPWVFLKVARILYWFRWKHRCMLPFTVEITISTKDERHSLRF